MNQATTSTLSAGSPGRRWPRRALLPALGALVLGWVVVPADYKAQTLLHLSPRAPRPGEPEADLATYQRTQAALVKTYAVRHGTLEKPAVADLAEVRAHPGR
jgi:hypothetical protein